jgi:hypothetical protein
MCLGGDKPPVQPAPPPPAPPPIETAELSIKGSAEKTTSKRKKSQKSGKSAFRSDLAVNINSESSGLTI